jgi:hypothetical protein
VYTIRFERGGSVKWNERGKGWIRYLSSNDPYIRYRLGREGEMLPGTALFSTLVNHIYPLSLVLQPGNF